MMEPMGSASPLVNQSQHTNSSLVSSWSQRSAEYSDTELVLLGTVMALLVLAIVFGEVPLSISGGIGSFVSRCSSVQVMCW